MTEKLFYKDVYQTSFEGVVISCESFPEQTGRKALYQVALDKTAFYPEGGGQPSDVGKIWIPRLELSYENSNHPLRKGVASPKHSNDLISDAINNAVVSHVFEKDGVVFHEADKPFEPGEKVNCEVDFLNRLSNMQNHSGEHIVSGIIKQKFGFDNVGFHMGKEFITIDISGELNDKDIGEIETLANETVYKNLDIDVLLPNDNDYKKMNARSKKELSGDIRVVQIEGVDTCACCGTHVRKTGEIGVIKLISHQRYKGGARISMLCGHRALLDYGTKNKIVYKISALLSAKPNEVAEAAEKMLSENERLEYKLVEQRLKLFKLIAESIAPCEKLCIFEDDLTPIELKQLCEALMQRADYVLVLSETEPFVYKYALGSLKHDIGVLGKALNEKFNGRGGGKGIIQGALSGSREGIKIFFELDK